MCFDNLIKKVDISLSNICYSSRLRSRPFASKTRQNNNTATSSPAQQELDKRASSDISFILYQLADKRGQLLQVIQLMIAIVAEFLVIDIFVKPGELVGNVNSLAA
jgi:hypothetical protein